ncbi:MAG: hypothetical protein ACPGJS_20570 [Flammeovirgaceae bacterium]
MLKIYVITCLYVIICTTIAHLGRRTLAGFWGMLGLSLMFTPIFTFLAVVIMKPWKNYDAS